MEPPIVIRTVIVVVVVDIATRRQRFRASSLLPRMMSANHGLGREPTRRSAVPSPSPPDRDDVPVPSSFGVAPPTATAVVGGRHRSLLIVPLSRTVAVIFLVLLLPPERTPIPDRARSRDVRPPLLLCPLRFFPRRDRDDRPAPSLAFRLPPPPADPDPNGGDAATPEEPNSASPLSRGASNSSPTPSGISAAPPQSSSSPPSSSSSLSTGLPHRRRPPASVDPSRAALST